VAPLHQEEAHTQEAHHPEAHHSVVAAAAVAADHPAHHIPQAAGDNNDLIWFSFTIHSKNRSAAIVILK